MKKIILSILVIVMTFPVVSAQTSDTIRVVGFTYVPADLTVNVGDSVIIIGNDFHPLVEVSENTWNSNGITPLDGGFAFPSGSGKMLFSEAGVHFFVCTAHVASNGMKGKITVGSPSAIPDLKDNGRISVYPIPLTGATLYISFKNHSQKNLTVAIYDLAGNLRISYNGSATNGKFAIDCTDLPSGLFLMKLSSDEGDSYTKFVKQ